jgi:hypothetical protein
MEIIWFYLEIYYIEHLKFILSEGLCDCETSMTFGENNQIYHCVFPLNTHNMYHIVPSTCSSLKVFLSIYKINFWMPYWITRNFLCKLCSFRNHDTWNYLVQQFCRDIALLHTLRPSHTLYRNITRCLLESKRTQFC